jgi:hypothetical protein
MRAMQNYIWYEVMIFTWKRIGKTKPLFRPSHPPAAPLPPGRPPASASSRAFVSLIFLFVVIVTEP